MGGNGATQSTTENTDVSTKPRHRPRDGYFWQLLILRIPMAVFAVVIIVYLKRYVRKWQGVVRPSTENMGTNSDGKDALGQSGLPLGMASVSLAVAVWEVIARVVPQYEYGPRSLDFLTIFFDLVVVGLGVPGWLNFAFADYYASGYPTPWREDQDLAATLIVIFWVFHFVIAIVGCSTCADCCGCASASTKLKKAAVTTAPVQPAQRPDLEQAGAPDPLPNYKQSIGLEEIEPATNPGDPPSYPEVIRLKDLSRSE